MDEAFKKELIEHCKRQMQRFERMGRTDSFAYKEHAVLLSFLSLPNQCHPRNTRSFEETQTYDHTQGSA